jgi:hypothetical protein
MRMLQDDQTDVTGKTGRSCQRDAADKRYQGTDEAALTDLRGMLAVSIGMVITNGGKRAARHEQNLRE